MSGTQKENSMVTPTFPDSKYKINVTIICYIILLVYKKLIIFMVTLFVSSLK